MKSVNVYDFDHTIYRGDASLDFIIFCLVRHPTLLRYLPIQAWALFLYVVGKWDRKQIKQVAFSYVKNIRDIDSDVHRFWKTHEHKVESWYIDQKASTDIIISASPEFLLEPIAESLGIKKLIGTRMDKRTGKISGKNCRAEEKVVRLKQYNADLTIHKAYSDTLSDLPLLKLAEEPYIVQKGKIVALDNHRGNSKKALFRELFLYGIIGGSTAALDVLLFHILVTIGVQLFIANFVSVSIAVGSSFILNAKYNFKKTDKLGKRATQFFAIGYFGWFVQTIILWIGVSLIGFGETYVKIFAVFVAAAIQYLLNKFLTFRN